MTTAKKPARRTTARNATARKATARKATARRRTTRRPTPRTATTIGAGIGTLVVALLLGSSWPVRITLVVVSLVLVGGYLVVQGRRSDPATIEPAPTEPIPTDTTPEEPA